MAYTYSDNCLELKSSMREKLGAIKAKVRVIINGLSNANNLTKDYAILQRISVSALRELKLTATEINTHFKNIVIIGSGGSVLNPRMICSLSFSGNIRYLDSMDPIYYTATIGDLNLRDTCFLVISKSGETTEVLAILEAVLEKFKKQQISEYSQNFYFIVGNSANRLRGIAERISAKIFDHDDRIGGRFSGFTNVGLLPGLIAGINADDFIDGGNAVIDEFWAKGEESAPARAAASLFLLNKPLLVNIGYIRSLSAYLDWQLQIIAESLGKDGKGYTPIKNLGSMDQHSMFQLYLDGPDDKVFTFINTQPTLEYTRGAFSLEDEVQVKILGNMNFIAFSATLSACKAQGLPVREIILKEWGDRCMGELIMHSMIEIIVLAHLMGVNPFGQPGVEKIKSVEREILSQNGLH